MNYHDILNTIGLSEKESSIYIALLELNQSEVTEIARKANIKRPTTYLVLEELEQKGLVSRIESGKILRFQPTDPRSLITLERSRLNRLEEAIPGLLGIASQNKYKPNTRFFTGVDGIRTVYEETLIQPSGSEMLALGHAQIVEEELPGFGDWYIKRRIKNNITVRALTPATPGGVEVAERDKKELRHTRLLDVDSFTEPVEINIYGNKTSFVSLIENELVGAIIESKVFTAAQRQIYEILWKNAKGLDNEQV